MIIKSEKHALIQVFKSIDYQEYRKQYLQRKQNEVVQNLILYIKIKNTNQVHQTSFLLGYYLLLSKKRTDLV